MADDFSELNDLVRDLTAAPKEVAPFVKTALKVTGMELKGQWSSRAKIGPGYGFSSRYASSIDFDERDTQAGPEIEVGPNLGKGGGTAGFLDEPLSAGGVTTPPMHAGRDALEAALPDLDHGLERAVSDGTAKALGAS